MWLVFASAGVTPVRAAPPAEKQAPAEKKPDQAPAREELAPDEVRKAEKFFDELSDAVVKHQDACSKMASALHALLTKHQGWLKKVIESGKDVPQASKDKLHKRQGEVMGGIWKCKDDKGVQGAKERFLSILASKRTEGGAAAASSPPAKK